MSANLDTLEHVASRLGTLRREVVFVGGAVSELLISDPGAPQPRMTGDIDAVLGFSNRWYADTLRQSRTTRLPRGTEVRVITGPYFIATKLEAFFGRGRSDFAASHDIEDVVAVIDGRPELVAEVQVSPSDLRAYLSEKFGSLLRDQRFLDSVPGHLPPDEASQGRLGIVFDRMKLLTVLP